MEFDIFFRAFELTDAEFISSLRKNEEFENLVGGNKRFIAVAREQKWLESLIMNDYQDRFYVAICEKSSGKIIGYTSVSDIDHVNKSCFWSGIKIHSDHNGKGYGTQTVLLILKFVFEELNMERCTGQCLEEHVVAKKLMEKVGFKVEALQRHSLFKNGKYHNQFVLSILKDEYPQIKTLFNI
ncbi:GNAT family N-acetyltransferase [Chryseobacterium caseinilyticum]|uniref:GNAT family N-acetyltransferase n=1 Tax=Chryseobacterium caseinilyticum TaxID=2771428 RepID=A0ABR8ZAS1_9FLAO|nr:GNAT family protein [Chryseobacterium caseinilyticum]MBD8082326.1 GNAT family N-acetyltransferase [Chryseobacterium caseinilyticum]